jgi:hypothetical protein
MKHSRLMKYPRIVPYVRNSLEPNRLLALHTSFSILFRRCLYPGKVNKRKASARWHCTVNSWFGVTERTQQCHGVNGKVCLYNFSIDVSPVNSLDGCPSMFLSLIAHLSFFKRYISNGTGNSSRRNPVSQDLAMNTGGRRATSAMPHTKERCTSVDIVGRGTPSCSADRIPRARPWETWVWLRFS